MPSVACSTPGVRWFTRCLCGSPKGASGVRSSRDAEDDAPRASATRASVTSDRRSRRLTAPLGWSCSCGPVDGIARFRDLGGVGRGAGSLQRWDLRRWRIGRGGGRCSPSLSDRRSLGVGRRVRHRPEKVCSRRPRLCQREAPDAGRRECDAHALERPEAVRERHRAQTPVAGDGQHIEVLAEGGGHVRDRTEMIGVPAQIIAR